MSLKSYTLLCLACGLAALSSCADYSAAGHGTSVTQGTSGKLLASHPSVEERKKAIENEPVGDYFIGRRYVVDETTFWGYLRKPRNSWSTAELVLFNESELYSPDRLPEYGDGKRRGYDQNFEYRLGGYFTGAKVYEPNSNQVLPEFKLQSYELISENPGWIFSPSDRYNPKTITLLP
jgi:hypothetical protein